jgi:hypothetical protein
MTKNKQTDFATHSDTILNICVESYCLPRNKNYSFLNSIKSSAFDNPKLAAIYMVVRLATLWEWTSLYLECPLIRYTQPETIISVWVTFKRLIQRLHWTASSHLLCLPWFYTTCIIECYTKMLLLWGTLLRNQLVVNFFSV